MFWPRVLEVRNRGPFLEHLKEHPLPRLVGASSACFQTNYCRLGTCSLPLMKSGAPLRVGMAETGLPSVVRGRRSASQVSPGDGGCLTERYNAPNNISVHCNESHCLIRWEQPRTRQPRSNREFRYQLDVQGWVSGLSSEQGNESRGAWQAAPPPATKERAGGLGVGGDPGSAARPAGPRVDTGETSESWLPRLNRQKKAGSLCYTSPGTRGLYSMSAWASVDTRQATEACLPSPSADEKSGSLYCTATGTHVRQEPAAQVHCTQCRREGRFSYNLRNPRGRGGCSSPEPESSVDKQEGSFCSTWTQCRRESPR